MVRELSQDNNAAIALGHRLRQVGAALGTLIALGTVLGAVVGLSLLLLSTRFASVPALAATAERVDAVERTTRLLEQREQDHWLDLERRLVSQDKIMTETRADVREIRTLLMRQARRAP